MKMMKTYGKYGGKYCILMKGQEMMIGGVQKEYAGRAGLADRAAWAAACMRRPSYAGRRVINRPASYRLHRKHVPCHPTTQSLMVGVWLRKTAKLGQLWVWHPRFLGKISKAGLQTEAQTKVYVTIKTNMPFAVRCKSVLAQHEHGWVIPNALESETELGLL